MVDIETDSSRTPAQQLPVHHVLDVRHHFNPIDCMSLKFIREELKPMIPLDVLLVLCNMYQKREIQAWCKKVGHSIVLIKDDAADNELCRIYIEKSHP